jgi:hypothetical protein
LTAVSWRGVLSALTDEELDARLRALSEYVAAGLVLRGRDVYERERREPAAPAVLWRETHDEIVRRCSVKPDGSRSVTHAEFLADFGDVPFGPD